MRLDTQSSAVFNTLPGMPPETAWQIDTKLDDGDPLTGMINATHLHSADFINLRATNSSDCLDNNDYNFSFTANACGLKFRTGW